MTSTVQPLECPKCGASLMPLSPADDKVRCAFCGTVSAVRATEALGEVPLRPVSLGSPIWLIAWGRGIHAWLWPRAPESTEDGDLAIVPFADPYGRDDDLRPPTFSLIVAERLALETRLNVRSVVAIRPDGRGVLCDFTGPIQKYEDTGHWVEGIKPSPIASLAGEHGASVSHDAQLLLRSPAYGDPAVCADMGVPVGAVTDRFLDWLVAQGRVARVLPPTWYAPPPAPLLQRYAQALQSVLFFVLAKNKLLSVLPTSSLPRYIDVAYDLAREPGAPPQCRHFPLTLTILAAQMGRLDAGHRRQALDVVRAATAPGDLLTWLSPRVFRVLGAVDEAEARVKSFGPQTGAYADWLGAIAQPE